MVWQQWVLLALVCWMFVGTAASIVDRHTDVGLESLVALLLVCSAMAALIVTI